MFIAYTTKNGILYATLMTSKRKNGKVEKTTCNLGRVLDKERGIFQNRKRGVFIYDIISKEYKKTPADFVPNVTKKGHIHLILDFGDAYFVDEFLKQDGLMKSMEAIGYGNSDTLKSMLCYYILCGMSNCHASSWWEGSFARILYPNANLTSQRISDFLAAIGKEEKMRCFFAEYFYFLTDKLKGDTGSILIDSTGLPNSIHFPLTAISNHNGEINNEVRLIYVTHQQTGLPIYFRYCPGNIIDVTTLARTIIELQENGIDTKFSIMDAGYYDNENTNILYECGISFLLRLKKNLKLYKELLKKYLASLQTQENMVKYNSRFVYIKCVECKLVETHKAYAYIGLDLGRKHNEAAKLFKRAERCEITTEEVHRAMETQGIFILVSSRRIAKDKILPLYYTRQQIEQIFDIGKNYANFLPLSVQNEATFRGHLLLTFIAAVAVKRIQDHLTKSEYNPMSMFLNLRNQKCKVYNNTVVTMEAAKKANDCYKLFNLKCPLRIPLPESLCGKNSQ
ncbi:MAG: transposase [Lentisphaeria bacterium]